MVLPQNQCMHLFNTCLARHRAAAAHQSKAHHAFRRCCMHTACRPHFEAYEQQLLQLGLELPPLLANIFSSSSGSGATPTTAPYISMHSSAAGASVADRRSFDLNMQAAAAAAATPGHVTTGQKMPSVMSLGGVAAAAGTVHASREGSNSSVASSSCPRDFSEIGCMSVCASQRAGEIEVATWSDTQQSLQQQTAAEAVGKDKHRSNIKKQGAVRWLHKRLKMLLQCSNDRSSKTTTSMGQQQQPSVEAAAAAAAAQAAPEQQQQQQQQQEEQQPCDNYVGELPTLSELRLLPPLRHTLSTVLSSNLSTVMSSLGSNSAAMQAVYENSSTGSDQPSSLPLCTPGTAVYNAADVPNVVAAAGIGAQAGSSSGSGNTSAGGSSGNAGESSSSSSIQQGSTRWSLMLQAAGLNTGGSSSSSSDAPITHTAVHSSSMHAAADVGTCTAAAPHSTPQHQQHQQQHQQHQQQLAAHELQHMHMLAERYAAQHQLHAEPSGLSTITERSETRTTPRGLSFTSNFIHEFTVLSGRPSCELHWELGRQDSYSSQTTSACPFAGYTYVPQQHQHSHQQGVVSVAAAAAAMQHPLNATVTAGQSQSQERGLQSQSSLTNHGEPLQMVSSSTAEQHDLQGSSSIQPLVVPAAVQTPAAAQLDAQPVAPAVAHAPQLVATVTAAGAEACSAGPAVTATSSTNVTSSSNPTAADQPEAAAAAAAAMPVAALITAATAAAEPDAEDDALLQQGIQQEQNAMQAALQRLRAQLSSSDVLAAVPSSWGSCDDISDSGGFAIQGDSRA
jgi:hypothetical protein